MPGWHEDTRALREAGKLQMFGIVQEQHPERARLLMQWKQMDWPVAVDAYNRLGVTVVPITVAIDEHGVVRHVKPSLEDVEEFADTTYAPPPEVAPPPTRWREPGISALEGAVSAKPDDAVAHFRLGVALRDRHDSPGRQPGDFRRAVSHWTRALALDPNNYIWRRRIQQYGPRLDKPYPFYDWVGEARTDIEGRGDEPVTLSVEPSGAELAHPQEELESAGPASEPDPEGRVKRDDEMVAAEVTVVPAAIEAGQAARVHIELRPQERVKAHWNNEAEETRLWVEAVEGWTIGSRLLEIPLPRELVTSEVRSFELEVRAPPDARPGTTILPAYALYYVCEDVDGTCLYRRRDLPVKVQITR